MLNWAWVKSKPMISQISHVFICLQIFLRAIMYFQNFVFVYGGRLGGLTGGAAHNSCANSQKNNETKKKLKMLANSVLILRKHFLFVYGHKKPRNRAVMMQKNKLRITDKICAQNIFIINSPQRPWSLQRPDLIIITSESFQNFQIIMF